MDNPTDIELKRRQRRGAAARLAKRPAGLCSEQDRSPTPLLCFFCSQWTGIITDGILDR
jgi:hypothetical protein